MAVGRPSQSGPHSPTGTGASIVLSLALNFRVSVVLGVMEASMVASTQPEISTFSLPLT